LVPITEVIRRDGFLELRGCDISIAGGTQDRDLRLRIASTGRR
jgi:hypothetical protein